jgi:hypothetical protein
MQFMPADIHDNVSIDSMRAVHVLFSALVYLSLGCDALRVHDMPGQSAARSRYEIGKEVEAEGAVSENVLGCRRDGACYIRLKTSEGEVTAVYAVPMGTPCVNEKAMREGMEIRKGERIRVFARATGPTELSTCDDPKYFFATIKDR